MRSSKLIAASSLVTLTFLHMPASGGQGPDGYAHVVNNTGHSLWISLFTRERNGDSTLVKNGCLAAGDQSTFSAQVRPAGMSDATYAGWTYWIDIKAPATGCTGPNIEPSLSIRTPLQSTGVRISPHGQTQLY